jgi:hypothetical protein
MTRPVVVMAHDPFGDGRKETEPDSVQAVAPQADELVETAYNEFFIISNKFIDPLEIRGYISQMGFIKDRCILNPPQIKLLLDRIIEDRLPDFTHVRKPGLFLAALIQDSYTYGGHNNFTLATGDVPIIHLGDGIVGTPDNRITLAIKGNVGRDCGAKSRYAHFDIRGNVGDYCGDYAEYSQFTIHGDAGYCCGNGAVRSRFNIYGDVDMLGRTISGSEFAVHRRDLFERLKDDLRRTNTLRLVDDAGNILVEECR